MNRNTREKEIEKQREKKLPVSLVHSWNDSLNRIRNCRHRLFGSFENYPNNFVYVCGVDTNLLTMFTFRVNQTTKTITTSTAATSTTTTEQNEKENVNVCNGRHVYLIVIGFVLILVFVKNPMHMRCFYFQYKLERIILGEFHILESNYLPGDVFALRGEPVQTQLQRPD